MPSFAHTAIVTYQMNMNKIYTTKNSNSFTILTRYYEVIDVMLLCSLIKHIIRTSFLGAAVAEWLSSWLAEQEDRGSIPGLAT